MSSLQQTLANAGIKRVNSTELYADHHQAGDAGLAMLVIENKLGRAVLALQGAHLMSYRAAGKEEMLWVSPKSLLVAGKPIRGGIPLCLPWFGPSADGQVLHGFARNLEWSVQSAELMADGATRLVMELAGDASISERWPHAFIFSLQIVVGSKLDLTLSVANRDSQEAPLAFAFHTYFAVPNVAEAHIAGLAATSFIDKTDNFTRKTQHGEVTISAMTDRVYLDVPQRQTLVTPAGSVTIDSPAKCAVVWNAWNNDQNIADIGAGNHVGYLCVERGDCADYALTLAAGGSYRTTMTLAYGA
jgi:D-hexose-6-phosphate mutarotase